jgi:AcrR family transcriptional regulator
VRAPAAPADPAYRRPDGRRSRWEDHRSKRREELIEAVLAVVRARGAGVSMDDIAAQSGIAKPVFYRYFTDKADIHAAVGRTVAQAVVDLVTTAVDRPGSARAKLAAGIEAYLTSIEADPEIYRFVVHAAPHSGAGGVDTVQDYASVVGLHAGRVIGDLLRQAGRDTSAAEIWGFALVGMVRAAVDRWLEHRSIPRSCLVDYLTDLVVPGFTAALSGTTHPPAAGS